jgi:membrane protein DedA with SNARE-associated domain
MHNVLNPADMAQWITAWGYTGIFICIFIGNVGIPVPEETVLLAAGFLTARDILDFRVVVLVSIVSAVVGDNCGYLVGRIGGRRLLDRLSSGFEFAHRRYERFKVFFHQHGNKTVFFARFIAGLRFMAGPMAGSAGMPFWHFFGWNVLGAIVWCPLMVLIGYVIGDQWDLVAPVIHKAGHWATAAIVFVVLAIYLFIRERRSSATGA